MTNIGFILDRLEQCSETPMVLNWVQWTNVIGADPVTGTKRGTCVKRSKTVYALSFDPVTPATLKNVLYAELEIGDAIVYFPPSVQLDCLDQPYFVIDGERWVQKKLGERLARSMKSIARGQLLSQGLVLTKSVASDDTDAH